MKRKKTAPPATVKPAADTLNNGMRTFAFEYLANGFNATQAYLKAHPAVSDNTAGVEGHRLLRKPKVRAFLNPLLEEAWKPLQMGGEQALARVALLATEARKEGVRLAALKVILEQTGKLSSIGGGLDALAEALRADQAKNGRAENP